MPVTVLIIVLFIEVNEWLLFNAAISWREQVNFQWDDDKVRFVLYQHAVVLLLLQTQC